MQQINSTFTFSLLERLELNLAVVLRYTFNSLLLICYYITKFELQYSSLVALGFTVSYVQSNTRITYAALINKIKLKIV